MTRRAVPSPGRALAAWLACAIAPAASAGNVTLEAIAEGECFGAERCVLGAVTMEAGPPPARFDVQDYRGVYGLGVSRTDTGAPRDHELQGPILAAGVPGETITVTFERPHEVQRVVLAHLYNPAVPGDPTEEAVIDGFAAGRKRGRVSVLNHSDAAGDFQVLGMARSGVMRSSARAGAFVLLDPFAGPVDRLVFRATGVGAGDTADYSIVAIGAVPAR